ncbi:putative ubiquitin-protein ligase [Hibiscus syriacus]|uniref:Ubiquitin-protein ligase n=1 Tax=Hibiscus syriacus TaxID=106335 RepID=A0A6A3AWC2_HIBSY|nr:putative ubiquitin-protein ligase [Hibiscus syriacus]
MVHGYGGNPLWQFIYQVGPLLRRFNLFIPDLLFSGRSYSKSPLRSDLFQAKCLLNGLGKLGVDRFSLYASSYVGFVEYRMAEMRPDVVERMVIMSSGLLYSDEQRAAQLKEIGRHPTEILVPKKPNDLRLLVKLSMCKENALNWVPDFFIRQFITVSSMLHIPPLMYDHCRKEKVELANYLVEKKADTNLPAIPQETLIIWGEHDKVFPLELAFKLQRHLVSSSRLEIIKNAGHAANMESPDEINNLLFQVDHPF